MLGKSKKRDQSGSTNAPCPDGEIDAETGLSNAAGFEEVLSRQIARDLRYGSNSALALFEIAVAERQVEGPLPSPAPLPTAAAPAFAARRRSAPDLADRRAGECTSPRLQTSSASAPPSP